MRFALKVFSFSVLSMIIFLLAFSVAFRSSPFTIGKYLVAQVGSGIGVTATIPVNPLNTLTQQLRDKDAVLQERENVLLQREAEIQSNAIEQENRLPLYFAAGGIVFASFIALNFYLDYKRRRRA
jgi:hypothetical protein